MVSAVKKMLALLRIARLRARDALLRVQHFLRRVPLRSASTLEFDLGRRASAADGVAEPFGRGLRANTGFNIGTSTDVHPAVIDMRLRAANELFWHFDLPIVPGVFREALKSGAELVQTFELFVVSLGVDVILVRQRDLSSIGQLQDAVLALSRLEEVQSSLSSAAYASLLASLQSGDHETVRTAVDRVETIVVAKRNLDAVESRMRRAVPRVSHLKRQIENVSDGPWAVNQEVISDIKKEAALFLRLVGDLNELDVRAREILERAKADLSVWRHSDCCDDIDDHIDALNQVMIDIFEDALVSATDISAGAECGFDFCADLEALLDAACAKKRRDDGATKGANPGGGDSVERALRFFGFEPHDRPSKADVGRAYNQVLMKHHHSYGTAYMSEEEKRRKSDNFESIKRQADEYRSILVDR